MKRTIFYWVIAVVLTLSSAYYQRITGPTYPLTGKFVVDNRSINYKFDRSHDVTSNQLVEIKTDDKNIHGRLVWKRYNSSDSLTFTKMKFNNGSLQAELPAQPAAGKIQYYVELAVNDSVFASPIRVPTNEPVVTRFKGAVPAYILIPHIIMMFVSMLLSTRAGIEYFNPSPSIKKHTIAAFTAMAAGGMILGPLTQLYAFGALWTGFPFGYDLTDNKTLIAFIAWGIALIAVYKSKKPALWVLAAAVLTLIVFLIPHSMFGSELKYQ